MDDTDQYIHGALTVGVLAQVARCRDPERLRFHICHRVFVEIGNGIVMVSAAAQIYSATEVSRRAGIHPHRIAGGGGDHRPAHQHPVTVAQTSALK